ncbi:major capsid protein [human gut metagenome]|uniref:Major capsid protein n=1 Tax=human gut metagenome TaxID=408170 RepID=K1UTK4_9ZZZZ
MYFPVNGAYDPEKSLAIVGDWSQLVYAIRQDMTFKIFDSGVVQDPTTGDILYNLMQNDMVALRAVMRLAGRSPTPSTLTMPTWTTPSPSPYTPPPPAPSAPWT